MKKIPIHNSTQEHAIQLSRYEYDGMLADIERLRVRLDMTQSKLNQLHEAYTIDIGRANDVIDKLRVRPTGVRGTDTQKAGRKTG